jgi:hypothetical protein
LSPDAFTRFGEHNATYYNAQVERATAFLHQVVIPKTSCFLDSCGPSSVVRDHLGSILHSRGVNLRHLGRVRALCTNADVRRIILAHMAVRVIKDSLRADLRHVVKVTGSASDYPLRRLITSALNVLVTSPDAARDILAGAAEASQVTPRSISFADTGAWEDDESDAPSQSDVKTSVGFAERVLDFWHLGLRNAMLDKYEVGLTVTEQEPGELYTSLSAELAFVVSSILHKVGARLTRVASAQLHLQARGFRFVHTDIAKLVTTVRQLEVVNNAHLEAQLSEVLKDVHSPTVNVNVRSTLRLLESVDRMCVLRTPTPAILELRSRLHATRASLQFAPEQRLSLVQEARRLLELSVFIERAPDIRSYCDLAKAMALEATLQPLVSPVSSEAQAPLSFLKTVERAAREHRYPSLDVRRRLLRLAGAALALCVDERASDKPNWAACVSDTNPLLVGLLVDSFAPLIADPDDDEPLVVRLGPPVTLVDVPCVAFIVNSIKHLGSEVAGLEVGPAALQGWRTRSIERVISACLTAARPALLSVHSARRLSERAWMRIVSQPNFILLTRLHVPGARNFNDMAAQKVSGRMYHLREVNVLDCLELSAAGLFALVGSTRVEMTRLWVGRSSRPRPLSASGYRTASSSRGGSRKASLDDVRLRNLPQSLSHLTAGSSSSDGVVGGKVRARSRNPSSKTELNLLASTGDVSIGVSSKLASSSSGGSSGRHRRRSSTRGSRSNSVSTISSTPSTPRLPSPRPDTTSYIDSRVLAVLSRSADHVSTLTLRWCNGLLDGPRGRCLQQLLGLRHLDLTGSTRLGPETLAAIPRQVVDLVLDDCSLDCPLEGNLPVEVVASLCSLSAARVRGLYDSDLMYLATHGSRLVHLSLSQCRGISKEGIIDAFSRRQFGTHLLHLNVVGIDMDSATLVTLSRLCPRLVTLHVGESPDLPADQAKTLSQSTMPELGELLVRTTETPPPTVDEEVAALTGGSSARRRRRSQSTQQRSTGEPARAPSAPLLGDHLVTQTGDGPGAEPMHLLLPESWLVTRKVSSTTVPRSTSGFVGGAY